MKPKQLLILAVFLAAAIGAVLVANSRRNKAGVGGTGEVGKVVFPDLQVNDVARIAIAGPKGSVTLAQKDGSGTWGVEERGGYAADVAKLRTFVLDLGKLKVAQTTSAGASQLGRLGLLAPDSGEGAEGEKGTVVEFAAGDGTQLLKATVGKEFKTGGASADPMMGGGYATGRYLMVDGRSDVLVISDQLYSLQSEPAGWLKKESFRVEKPKTVTVTYPEGDGSFTLSKEEETGQFKLADLSETETLDDAKTGGYGNIFSSGSFADVLVGDAATDEKTGLDKPTTVAVETFDGFKYVVSIGKKIAEGGEGEEEDAEGAMATATARYPVRYTVSAEFPTERKIEGETEETEEQKKERDAAFELKQKTSKEKLETESALAGTVYLLDSWVIDQVLKKRSDLLKAPTPEGGEEDANAAVGGLPPGVSVTTPPVAVPPPGDKTPITATTPPISLEDAIRNSAEENKEGAEGGATEPEPDGTEPEAPEAPGAGAPDAGGSTVGDEPAAEGGEAPDSGGEEDGGEEGAPEAGGEENP